MSRILAVLILLALCLHAMESHAGVLEYGPAPKIQESKTRLEVLVQTGPDKEEWRRSLVATDPSKVQFRWTTEYPQVGRAEWEISQDAQNWSPMARGDAGISFDKKSGSFTLDLASVLPATPQRPLQYYLRIVTYKARPGARQTTKTPSLRPKSDRGTTLGAQKADSRLQRRERAGVPSPALPLIYPSPGEMTRFTTLGLDPGLLTAMPIEITLETLTIKGRGGDEDPYLFVVVIYADGTTIIPEPDFPAKRIRFTRSSVRMQSPSKTHENVAGANVDVGVPLRLPSETGKFETTIRPIGVQVLNLFSLPEADLRRLRQETLVGLLVIGMEEDAVPSTEVMDQAREDLVDSLKNELDGLVRAVSVDMSNPTDLPDLVGSARRLSSELRDMLVDRALERGVDEFVANFKFLGFPSVVILPGALNADDYIGSRVATFSYEDILNAGQQGLPIDLQLNQRYDGLPKYLQGDTTEPIWYHLTGHVRLKQ